jgi:hypothetical protein
MPLSAPAHAEERTWPQGRVALPPDCHRLPVGGGGLDMLT